MADAVPKFAFRSFCPCGNLGFFAAKLIEDAGLKGVSVGGAMVSEKHSGFVVNTGNATAKDVCMLTDMVKDKVKQQSGVDLELEVIKLGDFS